MDKLSLLQARRQQLVGFGAEIRKKIAELVDEQSLVELDRFSFSKNEFYGEDVPGEGVVTGFATVNDFPCYVVAVNSQVLSGGLTNAGCKKIVKCLDKALTANAPVIYLLSSKGVVAGEGVSALEGVSEVLAKMDDLKGYVPQFAVCLGDVLGQASIFVAIADYAYYMKDSCVAYGSPLVISAKSGKALDKAAFGAKSGTFNGLVTFEVSDIAEVKESISDILDILPNYGGVSLETMDDANRNAPELNEKADAESLIKAVFDENYFVELNGKFAAEVVTGIGRIGGYSVAALIFDGDNGVELTKENIAKIKDFMYYADENDLPVVTFVNTLGIKNDFNTYNSTILKDVASLVYSLKTDMPKVNVIYGKAIGLGYTLFGSKNFGVDYSFAFANAKVSLFDENVGAELEMVGKDGDFEQLKARYEDEQMDAFAAAKCGYIDNVIEPEYVRQYVISALQMLL